MKCVLRALPLVLVLATATAAGGQDGVTRYVRYAHGGRTAYGILEGETIRELRGDPVSGARPTGRAVRLVDVRLLAPLDPVRVSKVVGVAINTRRPGREQPVAHPRFFAKMPTSLVGPEDEVEHPPEASNLDWEGELVLVIGRKGRHIPVEDAPRHIFGVTAGNDFSENTWYAERQGTGEPTRLFAKATDTWAPLGPVLVTGLDYGDLGVEIRVNGETVASGRTSQLLNSPAQLVSYVSRYMTLLPGDLIYTGTYPTLPGKDNTVKPGDVVEVEIERIGVLRNRVVAMRSPLLPPPVAVAAPAAAPAAEQRAAAPDPDRAPVYEVDPFWPRPLPNNWILGQVAGIAVDARDHVWIVHRPASLTPREAGAVQNPPLSECCVPAPPVIEFDPEGNVVRAWGGSGPGYDWPGTEHTIFVDHWGNVWLGGMGREDAHVLKFTAEGGFLLQIGKKGATGGSNDTLNLGRPAGIHVDPATNEVYIADGYRNRRVIVFDAETGAYRRHWGAYGRRPEDVDPGDYDPKAPPAPQFRNPVHAVRVSMDGLVYVADRVSNRIQVFRPSGEFVREAFLARNTRGGTFGGSVWDLAFSPDPAQTYLFVPDGTNQKVWILRRRDLAVLGSFGRGGRNAGYFGWVHNLALDSKANAYTAEVDSYKRVQRFRPVSGWPAAAGAPVDSRPPGAPPASRAAWGPPDP
ncbi:MAG: fumarylacetoacetate hydrolase family protein [Gemmatimonadetes bacterium]|nr:fumarylacetoacetate hydrolase family protein [Gemmatimonadota bacterium]